MTKWRYYRYYSEKLERWVTGKTDKMAKKTFNRKKIHGPDNITRWQFSISCSKPGCTKEDTFVTNGSNGEMDPQALAKIFRDKGWTVIDTKQDSDICNDCAKHKPVLQKDGPKMNGNGSAADRPREMDNTSKRRINAMLHEVYVVELASYDTGYNDSRVATDLGCAQAWVKSVREELFGPAADYDSQRVKEDIEKIKADFLVFKKSMESELDRILKTIGG